MDKLSGLGIDFIHQDENQVHFKHKGEVVRFFPFTGWHTGKSIKDGRGIDNLLKQIKLL